ncbi:hypothetical protein [Maritalea myrionectae]|uniref:Uncharacterized protein n=1 Tax=Maritalea myrionectae TaxID=454601 RepID=A0A2R4MGU9_9HYPH|nr:hypothetical protein [Maritalea myrionectae]AVX05242.1 hypothetical protein MXMO3_02731 [Maritalea myrionectae]
MVIRFAVMSFRQKGRALVADPMQSAKTADAAIALAERVFLSRDGAISFSQEIDVETDCYDEPKVLSKHGTLPPELLD